MYMRVIGLALALALGLSVFQNCAQPVSFNGGDALNSQSGETVEPVVPAEPIPEKGEYQFNVQTGQKEHLPLVKLIMIVDNSNSMKRYQDLLATGVKGMLAKLKSQKLNVDFHMYTTSATPGSANTSAEALAIEYVDAAGAVVTAAQVNGKPHVRKNKFRLAKSLALENNAPLGFRSNMTDAEMTAISNKLEAKIKAVGVNGADQESGLCTMLRVLKDKEANKIVAPGDRVAVVVLSDEDDSIKMENCYGAADDVYKIAAAEAKCSATNDCKAPFTYRATYSASTVLRVTLVHDNPACVMDGGLTEACKQNRSVNIDCAKSPALCPATAVSSASVVCSSAQQQAAATSLNIPVAQTNTCKFVHAESVTTLTLANQTEKGLCGKAFMNGGVNYANVAEYMKKKAPSVQASQWRDPCAEYGLVDGLKKTETIIKDSLVDTGSSAIEQTKALAISTLGMNSFRLSFVINDVKANMTEMCPAGTEKNKGLLYRGLGDLLPQQAFVSSICAKNYDVAMGDLGKFIESFALRSYTLNLVKPAQIESVSIDRAGVKTAVDAADFTFTVGQPSNLTFKDGLLQSGDKVIVKWVETL